MIGVIGLVIGCLSLLGALAGLIPFMTACASCGVILVACVGLICSGIELRAAAQDWEQRGRGIAIAGLVLNGLAFVIAAADTLFSLILTGGVV